jgi:hypothetical protein
MLPGAAAFVTGSFVFAASFWSHSWRPSPCGTYSLSATLPSLAIVAMETSRWVPDIFVRTSHVPSPGQVPSIR